MTNEKVLVDRELLRQVLFQLKATRQQNSWYHRAIEDAKVAAALSAALVEPAVEPVVWYDGRKFYATPSAAHMDCADIKELRPLYEAHQAQQPAPVQGHEMHEAMCPALMGGKCNCPMSPISVDKAWSQFCGGVGRGPDAPYPGMIGAFEAHYAQSFTDRDWRNESGVWAAAWKAAKARPAPVQEPSWLRLKPYGFAPGGYQCRCHKCGELAYGMDKHAITCLPCAENMFASKTSHDPQPVAWGVTE